jgi:NitT/TauT family transport system ATP-binding protein
MQPNLTFERVEKEFIVRGQPVHAVTDFSLDVYPGEFITIAGPSGCGKSTVLNMVAGLESPTAGRILYRGKEKQGIDPSIGYVTQRDNLLPWRTLLENVELGMEIAHKPKAERHELAQHWLERVGLKGFENHYPNELSGGMRQRGNIARTLVYSPDVILMDEPFGPLDAMTRLTLQDQLLELWEEERKTVLFITHDLGEAIALADRTVVMSARPGRLKRIMKVDLPRPRDIYHVHDQAEFRDMYNTLWSDIVEETRPAPKGTRTA